jgi:hypothetical protein
VGSNPTVSANIKDSIMRVLIFREEPDFWIGQALEHDLCVQGDTVDEVRHRMNLQVRLHNGDFEELVSVKGIESVHDLPPAPAEFFAMWEDLDQVAIRETINIDG